MAEPELSLEPVTLAGLRKRVSRFLGLSLTWDSLGSNEQYDVTAAIQDGLRRFYGEYDWHFLRPALVLNTASSVPTVDLPSDFGYLLGPLEHASDSGYPKVQLTSDDRIREQRVLSDSTGVPRLAAVRPKPFVESGPRGYELELYPTPDGTYALSAQYSISSQSIFNTDGQPYGADTHSLCIIEACLAAAESSVTDTQGLHEGRYRDELGRAVREERRRAPEYLGTLRNLGRPAQYRPNNDQALTYTPG